MQNNRSFFPTENFYLLQGKVADPKNEAMIT